MSHFKNFITRLSTPVKRMCDDDEEQDQRTVKRAKRDSEEEINVDDSSSGSESDEHYNVVVEKKKKFTLMKRPLDMKGSTPHEIVYGVASSAISNTFSFSSETVNRHKFSFSLRKSEGGATCDDVEYAKKFMERCNDVLDVGGNERASTSSTEDATVDTDGISNNDSTSSEYKSTNSVICNSEDEVPSTSCLNSKNCNDSSLNTSEVREYIDVENSDCETNTGNSSADNDVTDNCEERISSSLNSDIQNSESDVEENNSEDDDNGTTSEAFISHKSDVGDSKNVFLNIEPNEKCPICMAAFSDDQKVASPQYCSHLYCVSCICQWAEKNNVCPVDRMQFDAIVVKTYGSNQVVTKLYPFELDCM